LIPALLLGRKGSTGFPGKNTFNVLGRPLCYYPMKSALDAKNIDKVYLSTNDEVLMDIAQTMKISVIRRPEELCTNKALGEDAYRHGYEWIKKDNPNDTVEMIALLFCNAPTILPETLDEGIKILRDHPAVDSAVTVSRYNMWSPLRARREDSEGLLKPFVPFETFGDPKTLNCDRDSQGDVWFADMSASIVRPRCFDHMEEGLLPQRWMGQNIYPLKQWGGLDVDYEWQIPQIEFWLKSHGRAN
jgi:CMP-N-acetylneuraminic acid synthetase